jgi:taspase (threonine aspartase 1)
MISNTAKETWKKWKGRLENSEANVDIDEENITQDTVGAVAWHSNGGFAAGVSRLVDSIFLQSPHAEIQRMLVEVSC